MKKLYRISFKFTSNTRDFDKYFIAEDDMAAKKWFIFMAAKELKNEAMSFDEVIIPDEHTKVTAYYDDHPCVIAELHFLPERWMRVSKEKSDKLQFETMIGELAKEFTVKKNHKKIKK